jgi:hypothetical protein
MVFWLVTPQLHLELADNCPICEEGDAGVILSGNLSNWPVTDLLQMMRVTGKTAALRIEGANPGVIHFSEGKIVAASLAGQRGRPEPDQMRRNTIDALFVLTGPADGSFFVASPEVDPAAPSWEVAEIMAEVEHLRMIARDILAQGVDHSTPLVLSAEVPSPVTLHAEDWATLVSLVPAFSLESLERVMGRTRAFQVVNTLLARGLTIKDLTRVEVELVAVPQGPPPEPVPAPQSPPQDYPVLEWLGDRPAQGSVDLSTDIVQVEDDRPPLADDPSDQADADPSRRHLKAVVASPETTLVSGVLDDMRRLRTTSG